MFVYVCVFVYVVWSVAWVCVLCVSVCGVVCSVCVFMYVVWSVVCVCVHARTCMFVYVVWAVVSGCVGVFGTYMNK